MWEGWTKTIDRDVDQIYQIVVNLKEEVLLEASIFVPPINLTVWQVEIIVFAPSIGGYVTYEGTFKRLQQAEAMAWEKAQESLQDGEKLLIRKAQSYWEGWTRVADESPHLTYELTIAEVELHAEISHHYSIYPPGWTVRVFTYTPSIGYYVNYKEVFKSFTEAEAKAWEKAQESLEASKKLPVEQRQPMWEGWTKYNSEAEGARYNKPVGEDIPVTVVASIYRPSSNPSIWGVEIFAYSFLGDHTDYEETFESFEEAEATAWKQAQKALAWRKTMIP